MKKSDNKQIPQSPISRRDALKFIGISPIAASVLASTTTTTDSEASTDAKVNIVIVGGGTGGIMAAARLRRSAPNANINLIAPNEVHLYQPGQVFIAVGLYEDEDIKRDNSDFIPDGVTWIKDEVTVFDADNNKVITAKNGTVNYDYLVVATGIEHDYTAIEGMECDMVGKHNISSVYLSDPKSGTADGGHLTWEWMQNLREAAKNASPQKPIRALFTQPDSALKCGGAPQKMLYMSADFIRGNGPNDGADYSENVDFSFYKKGTKLFSIPEYNQTLEDVTKEYGNITHKFEHVLKKIDPLNKIATFEYTYVTQGEYDEDLEEYEEVINKKLVDEPYDFIHVVPPMKTTDALINSSLSWEKGSAQGYLECDQYTLQHRRYKNVFGIGDVLGIPKGKTGGSARHQGPVLVDNLIATIEGKELDAKFDGYTVCPLKTRYGKIVMAEFNYDGPSPSFPIDPTVERSAWWYFDIYMLKPMYWNLMLRGLM